MSGPGGVAGFLARYGPRLAVFALVVGLFAGWLALSAHLRHRRECDVGMRLDQILSTPPEELDRRIEALRVLKGDAASTQAEPWVLLCLGNQLYRKAEAVGGEEAERLNQEAYLAFLDARERHPEHSAAPLAMFSAGCAAEQLGRAFDAGRHFQDLKERYPSSFLMGSGKRSLQGYHAEGVAERIQRLKEAFPKGSPPEPEARAPEAPTTSPSEPAPVP